MNFSEQYIQLFLSIGIKVLFVLAVLTSIALMYQTIIVAGEYQILTVPDGPDKSDFESS